MVALSDLVKANDFLDAAKQLACQCQGNEFYFSHKYAMKKTFVCKCLKGRRVKEGEDTLARLISEIKKESENAEV